MATDRSSYVEVGRAMRVSIEAALRASPELSAGTMRVLLVILHEVPSWSRLSDAVTRKQIAERAGLTERTVSRAINRLVAVGAIEWKPGLGAGNTSQVALPIEKGTDTRPSYAQEKGTGTRPPLVAKKGDRIARKRGQSFVQKRGHRPAVNGATTRRFSEETPEKGARTRGGNPNPEERGARFDRVVSHDCDKCDGGWIENDEGGVTRCPAWT